MLNTRMAVRPPLVAASVASVFALGVFLFPDSSMSQLSVNVAPSKDNTLYESPSDPLSNGSGDYIFTGKTATGSIRRALIAFDVAGSVPEGWTIDSVRLTLDFNRTTSDPQPVELHRVLLDWGEGSSHAGGEEGAGAMPEMGDATWEHTFFDSVFWATAGGDFAPNPSAVSVVGDFNQYGPYSWGSTIEMVADVQQWLDDPATNFGWILVGNESTFPTSKRFSSKDNPVNPPMLTVFYSPPQAPLPPFLFAPPNNTQDVSLDITLDWIPSLGADTYSIQLSDTADFSNLLLDQQEIDSSFLDVSDLSIATVYYWRVSATNAGGTSAWSDVWSFTTIFSVPDQVSLVFPLGGAVIMTDSVVCGWRRSQPDVQRYWFEIADDSLFIGSTFDSLLTDTTKSLHQLAVGRYWWKVRARNDAGWGPFSEQRDFSVAISGVEEGDGLPSLFFMDQNYPNPFNPSTTIRYGLPQKAFILLEVFSLVGERITTIVAEEQQAGFHEAVFDGASLASGMYICRLRALLSERDQAVGSQFIEARKLILLR
jgi:hypothetical protein